MIGNIIKTCSKSLFLALLSWLIGNHAFAQHKPNIVVIFADDLGYGDLGCYDGQMIQTPHLDALSASGMRFTDYYAGSTVCAPSRESLLTGMHTGHTSIRGNFLTDQEEDPPMPDDKTTIAEYLKEAGYQTALIGKWGLGGVTHGPQLQGFDYSFGYLDQIKAHNYYPPYLWENGKHVLLEANENGVKGVCSHDLFVERTLNYLDTVHADHPFFLYLPYTYPHGAYTVPVDPLYEDKNWPKSMKVYATMVTTLDRNVGQIMQVLKDRGLAENTLVLFASDNGANPVDAKFFKSNGELRGGKRDVYEGGIRSPLIAYWPGKIKAGQVSDHVMAAWDFLPTFCQLAGLKAPENIDGISFLPALTNKDQTDHSYLYWEFYVYNYNWFKPGNELPRNYLESKALRIGQWKGVRKHLLNDKKAPLELYDLANDIGEQHDVAATHQKMVAEMDGIFGKCSTSDAPFFPYTPDSLAKLHVFDIHDPENLKAFFHYTPDRIPFVSSHRGGPARGYPENCLATFEHTLRHTWSLMEIDPHYTKDSAIVLMHDPTLDRTSTGHGKVSDHTLAELEQLHLKDRMGNETKYKIPTLAEALEWAKGKTILIIDQKDVPAETRAKIIKAHHAEANAMVMCYNYADAKKCHEIDKDIMMEVFVPDEESIQKFDSTGVPWSNVVAFVSHQKPKNPNIFQLIHQKGAMCIMGSSRNVDKDYLDDKISKTQLNEGYHQLINAGADIIEADLGVEAGDALRAVQDVKSSKKKYFETR